MFTVVSIKQRYGGHSTQAGLIASQCRVGAYAGKFVVVVDDDIDATNLDEVMWAVSTRCDPATAIQIVKNTWSTPLDPSVTPQQREERDFTNSRAIIDACRPFAWREAYPRVNTPTPEVAKKAWEKFGYLLK